MTGYQEVITDPSYRGQIVAMTYPQIGNYGINPEDAESREPHIRAFVIGELCEVPSNWRSTRPMCLRHNASTPYPDITMNHSAHSSNQHSHRAACRTRPGRTALPR